MTQTIQPVSSILIEKRNIQNALISASSPHSKEPKTEDNLRLLAALYDDLDNLYDKLNTLDHLLKKKVIELEMKQKQKENVSFFEGDASA